jgi:PKD repeat protein
MKKLTAILILAMLSFSWVNSHAQDIPVAPKVIRTGNLLGISKPLRDLPVLTSVDYKKLEQKAEKNELNERLQYRSYPYAATALPTGIDPVRQDEMGKTSGNKAPILNFDGQTSPYYPPDANGTAGPNHFMQTINTVYAIYNKSGALVAGPTAMNLLFGSVPGATCNDGDPVVLYDDQADRWVAIEFSLCGSNDYMLVAVSTTNNPTGTWYQYSFDVDDVPDYEKVGVWRDGYYMGTNTSNSGRKDIYVMQRSVMLSGGSSPQLVGFDNPWRPTTVDGFMCVPPVDNDGPFATDGSPGLFITLNDDAVGGGLDQLWIYELAVNWTTPASSTFTRSQQLNVAAFNSNFGNTWDNITQPGTTQKLDAIPMVIMNTPQYRNFGTYQTLVCCHTVNVDGSNLAGIRWYELRRTSGTWSIRQQGTYSPDAHSRWMASIALNGNGQIGLAYSISSSTVYPGIRYTGQSSTAYGAANSTMDIAEEIIQTGANSQSSYNRWGDYSKISIDPVDDQTFWFTTEYIGTGGTRKTKIASFQFGPIMPAAEFMAAVTTPCLNTTVNFTDQSTGSPTSWQWAFTPSTVTYVDGTTSTSQNPHVTFNAYGNYTVALTSTNANGNNTKTKSNYISVNNANPEFSASLTTVVVGNSTVFTDASTCNVTSRSWNFGDGASPATASTIGPHTVTYSTTGQKTVSLTVNSTTTNTKTDYINVVTPSFNMSNSTITTCTGTFYDSGGAGSNYLDNEDYTMVFNPGTVNSNLRIVFTSFDMEYQNNCNYDYLKIYNGNSITASLIGKYCGTTSPGTITASNVTGSLTFVFHSDASSTGTGWSATISCISTVGTPGLWTGITSSDWNTASNWSSLQVPDATMDVTVPVNAPNWPAFPTNFIIGSHCRNITLGSSSQMVVNGNLTINAGYSLTLTGAAVLKVGGNWTNYGIFRAGTGTVEFFGSSATVVTGGTNPASYLTNYSRSTFTKGMTNISAGTAGPSGDDASVTVNIGFTFNYLGTDYTQAGICTNGWVSLGPVVSSTYDNAYLFSTTAPNVTLAPWFDDQVTDSPTGIISYKTEGTSPNRIFTVEFTRMLTYYSTATARISYQVKLYETSNVIEFCYGNLEIGSHSSSESASIGIEDATGGSGHFIEATTGSSTASVTNLVSTTGWPAINYRFTPPPRKDTFYNLKNAKTNATLTIQPDIIVDGNLTISP